MTSGSDGADSGKGPQLGPDDLGGPDTGRETWAANSGWQPPQGSAKKSYRRAPESGAESPPVERESPPVESVAPASPAEELITQQEPVNPPVTSEQEGRDQEPSEREVWRATLLRAGQARLEELTDRLLELGGDIEGGRSYVTRIAPGVMAHVTLSVKLRKG